MDFNIITLLANCFSCKGCYNVGDDYAEVIIDNNKNKYILNEFTDYDEAFIYSLKVTSSGDVTILCTNEWDSLSGNEADVIMNNEDIDNAIYDEELKNIAKSLVKMLYNYIKYSDLT